MTGTPAGRGGAGQTLQDSRPNSIWGTITEHVSGNKYAWARIDEGDVPDFGELADSPEFSTGDDLPAYEIGGSDAVAVGSKVRLWPGGFGEQAYYTFAALANSGGGSGGTAGGCGWAAGLTADDCLEAKVIGASGRCSGLTATAAASLTTSDGLTWTGALTLGGVEYGVSFSRGACGVLCATLTAPGGSGGTYTGTLEGCAKNRATFSFGGAGLCTGEPGCGGAAENALRVQIAQVICGWDGPGWYCIRDCGTQDACGADELLEGDQYDLTIEICSGPHANEATAQVECTGLVPSECLNPYPDTEGTVAKRFTFVLSGITNFSGFCTCNSANTAYRLAWVGQVGGTCVWSNDWGYSPNSNWCTLFPPAEAVWTLRLVGGTTLELHTVVGSHGVSWSAPSAGWDGKSSITLTGTGVEGTSGGAPYCTNWPTSVTIHPVLP